MYSKSSSKNYEKFCLKFPVVKYMHVYHVQE